MSTDPGGSVGRSFRFSDAVHAITASLKGHEMQEDVARNEGELSRRHVIAIDPSSVEDDRFIDSFPTLTDSHLRDNLNLGEETRSQVMAAYDESKLNWDLDPRLIGGHRSEANLGMARVFQMLSVARLVDEDAESLAKGEAAGKITHRDASGNVIPAPAGQQQRGGESSSSSAEGGAKDGQKSKEVFQRQFETHDLLRAIDRKDTQLILTIRDVNFDLLLDLNQGGKGGGGGGGSMSGGTVNTPLGYCIGLGKGWEGVAVVLTGALSKFINNLPDEEEDIPSSASQQDSGLHVRTVKRARRELDPRTMSRLRKLRTSLKLAIDHSLSIDQTRLLSSYLQVLLMSSGQTFIRETIDSVHQALITHYSGSQVSASGVIRSSADPFQVASQAINSFFTESLRTKAQTKDVSQRIASVDDLIDNCIGDFFIMAIWQNVQLHRKELARIAAEEKRREITSRAEDKQLLIEMPTWSFARDDRIATLFSERVWSLEKVLDTIQWESGNQSTSATKSDRHPRIWKCARSIVDDIGTHKKRLNSKDRLQLLRDHVH